jgi:ubiquinone/menaquinone biosynthesis C-methylase UbiE
VRSHAIPRVSARRRASRLYGPDIREYYEELWQNLPEDLEPPDFELRLSFLVSALRPKDSVLDLGCGAGTFTVDLARRGIEVVGADVAEAALARARARSSNLDLRLVPFDGPLPFEDNSFTLVWASEVIEHVADTARWLSEVRRVLQPRGRLLLTTPSHDRLRVVLGGIERYSPPLGDHLHLYTRRSLAQVLGEFGFADVRVRRAGGLPLARRLLLAHAER